MTYLDNVFVDHDPLPALPTLNETTLCGAHRAASCAHCPGGHGQAWCNGECRWGSRL